MARSISKRRVLFGTGSGLNENYLHRPTCLKTRLPAGGAVNRGYGTFRMWSLDEASMSKGHALGVPVCSVSCVIDHILSASLLC